MKRSLPLALAFVFLFAVTGKAQLHTDKNPAKKTELKKTNIEFGFGAMRSVLYLSRNVKENNDALGYAFHFNYGGTKLLRLSFQYTFYKPINIAPTWYSIKAQTIETNIEIIARFPNGKTLLYPILGISYNTFKGYFTGVNDFLNLREHYKANSDVTSRWVGLNVGTGFEHAFGPVVIFLDYRMRVGKMEYGGINIMDVCYGAGVRIKLAVPPLHKLFKGTKDKYRWF